MKKIYAILMAGAALLSCADGKLDSESKSGTNSSAVSSSGLNNEKVFNNFKEYCDNYGNLSSGQRRTIYVMILAAGKGDCATVNHRLSKIQYLDLSWKGLTTIPANVFASFPQITILFLSGNQFTTINRGSFAGLTALEDLLLDNNPITSIDWFAFSNNTNLRSLNLNNNKISKFEQPSFAGLSKLDLLTLTSCKPVKFLWGKDAFSSLTNLQTLIISAAPKMDPWYLAELSEFLGIPSDKNILIQLDACKMPF